MTKKDYKMYKDKLPNSIYLHFCDPFEMDFDDCNYPECECNIYWAEHKIHENCIRYIKDGRSK